MVTDACPEIVRNHKQNIVPQLTSFLSRMFARHPTRAELQVMAREEARNVSRYFDRNRDNFEYIRYLNNGITGVSCQIRVKSGRVRRRTQDFVVKRGFRPGADRRLEIEYKALKV